MTFIRCLVAAALLAAMTIHASAEDRTVDVRFPPGATGTTISDAVVGRDAILFEVGAEAGQVMEVELASSNTATYFNVYAPGRGPGDEALAAGELTVPINDWSGALPASGDYTIAVFLYRSAARRGERSDFTLDISVRGETGRRVEADFADGLAGGPDFLQVAVSDGGALNLRAGPSAASTIQGRLADGQTVRNLGCRMSEGARWCRVATLADPGDEGWAAGDFLIEGAPNAAQPSMSPATTTSGVDAEAVRFAAGASGAEISGRLAPGDSRRYALDARDGQVLTVDIVPQGAPISYQIFNPDNSFLLDQISSDAPYRGQLWQSGNHVVEVINRTDAVARYSMVVGIE